MYFENHSAFLPKCTVVSYLYLSLTLQLDSPEFQNPSQNIRGNRRIHGNRFVLRIIQSKGNILLKISKKTSITYPDFEVLKNKFLIQAKEMNYENHLFRKFHVLHHKFFVFKYYTVYTSAAKQHNVSLFYSD